MPFTSKKQLRTYYAQQLRGTKTSRGRGARKSGGRTSGPRAQGGKEWDCDEWLKETPDPRCLPEEVGGTPHTQCRTMKKEERVTSPLYVGPRGGLYFYAGGKDGVKVYVPRDAREAAIRRYGEPREE